MVGGVVGQAALVRETVLGHVAEDVGDVPAVAPRPEALGRGAIQESLAREHHVRCRAALENLQAVADHRERGVSEAGAAVDGLVLVPGGDLGGWV